MQQCQRNSVSGSPQSRLISTLAVSIALDALATNRRRASRSRPAEHDKTLRHHNSRSRARETRALPVSIALLPHPRLTAFFFAVLFLVAFFAAFTILARAARPFVVAAGRRRMLALVFPRFAALSGVRLVPAFFVAVRFGVAVRLTGALVLVLAGFFAAAWRVEVAAGFFVAARRFEVAPRFGVAVRLTGALVLVLAGLFTAARRFEAAVPFRFDDFEARLSWPVRARTRLVPPLPRRLTTLRTPGPGTKLVSSPVLQRTSIIGPFTAVTTPDRGPAFDDTSIRSPTAAMSPPSRPDVTRTSRVVCRKISSERVNEVGAPSLSMADVVPS
jgi:hypothetical protein